MGNYIDSWLLPGMMSLWKWEDFQAAAGGKAVMGAACHSSREPRIPAGRLPLICAARPAVA